MPLFGRKDKTEDIAKKVANELVKSLAGTPYAGMSASGYAPGTVAQPTTGMGGQGLIQVAGEAVPMPRPGAAFGSMLGPAAPLLPMPIDPVLDTSGRALPRKWQFPVAANLNLTQTEVPYEILRSLAEQCDVVHRCIEIRVSEITKMDWSFSLSKQAIADIMQEENVSHAKAARLGREKYGEEINRLAEFWENPYVATDRSFNEWLTEALWQIFVFDQLCVYPRYSFGKKLLGLDIVDASTIKILLDNRGDIPHPPAPAYQQILWGFPRGEFIASPDDEIDGSFYNGDGRDGEFITDQLFVSVKNRRTYSPYGYSPVELSIPAATLYLERQTWMRTEYQAGATPQTWMRTNSQEMDVRKLAEFERILNDKLVGSTAERMRVKLLPDGFDPVAMPQIEDRYKPEYDEFIIKRIASAFGVAPQQLGVMPKSGLGSAKNGSDGEADNAEIASKKPMENYIVEVINSISRRFLDMDKNITFVLNDNQTSQNDEIQSKAFQIALGSGQMTLNDVRGELGLPLFDDPASDEPFWATPNGPVFFRGSMTTDATGNTIEQKEPDASVLGESPKPQVSEGQESPRAQSQEVPRGEGVEPQAPSQGSEAKTEIAAFHKFVKGRLTKGVWRDFTFRYINEDDAYEMNQNAQAVLKGEGHTPPKAVQDAAKRALEWIADGKAGDGFTDVGRKRAADLARGASVSMTTIRRMKAYFDRHQGDKDSANWNDPSPGKVAWNAWGGDAGYSWVKGIMGEQKAVEADPFYSSL